MVTKKKKGSTEKRGKKKVNNLKLNKETVKDLTDSDAEKVRGGAARGVRTILCPTTFCPPPTIKL